MYMMAETHQAISTMNVSCHQDYHHHDVISIMASSCHHQMQGLHHQADQASSGYQIIIISIGPITTGAPTYHQVY